MLMQPFIYNYFSEGCTSRTKLQLLNDETLRAQGKTYSLGLLAHNRRNYVIGSYNRYLRVFNGFELVEVDIRRYTGVDSLRAGVENGFTEFFVDGLSLQDIKTISDTFPRVKIIGTYMG